MNSLSHYATCNVWESGSWATCDCYMVPAWRIRKEPGEIHPWRIWRRTDDMNWEHLMRCSTYAGAVALVKEFIWLRNNIYGEQADA